MSRGQLKSLIKECLVEVLVEGLDPGSAGINTLTESRNQTKKSKSVKKNRPALDNIRFNDRVQQSVSMATSDPILGEMLADTAATTLQEQIESRQNSNMSHNHQVSVNGDQAAKAMSGADPTDIFGDAANNWAALAFNGAQK